MKFCDECYRPAVRDGIIGEVEGGTTSPSLARVVDVCQMCGRRVDVKDYPRATSIPVPEVTFTPEGGFRYNGTGPNPFVPKEKYFVTWVQASREAEEWGNDIEAESRCRAKAESVRAGSPANAFGRVDRGSLLRIASGVDHLCDKVDRLLEEVALQRRLELEWKIAGQEKTFGPCPPRVRRALLRQGYLGQVGGKGSKLRCEYESWVNPGEACGSGI